MVHIWVVDSYSSGYKFSYLIIDNWYSKRLEKFKLSYNLKHLLLIVTKYVLIIIFLNASIKK